MRKIVNGGCWGYKTMLENSECLEYITVDSKNVFEEMHGYNMNFALARSKTKLQLQVVKQSIPPIFTYLQHLTSKPTKDTLNSDDIENQLSNFFECDKKNFDKINFGGQYQYVFNAKFTKDQLKKYRYYVVENDDCENTNEEGVKFDIYAIDDDEESEEEQKVEYVENDSSDSDSDSEEFEEIKLKSIDTIDSDSDRDSEENTKI